MIDYVKLWRYLSKQGLDLAAYGLLCELLQDVLHYDWHRDAPKDTNPLRQHDTKRLRQRWARSREQLMEILDDKDGTKTAEWLRLYQEHLAAAQPSTKFEDVVSGVGLQGIRPRALSGDNQTAGKALGSYLTGGQSRHSAIWCCPGANSFHAPPLGGLPCHAISIHTFRSAPWENR